jgi:hypothetical protein
METYSKLLSASELALELGRSVRYVYYMKAKGFVMIGERATKAQALEFLSKIKNPCATSKKKQKR